MAACRMSELFQHIPVLLNEAVDNLIFSSNGTYVDATFGRGSHSKAILNRLNDHGRLIALDKDPEAIAFAKQQFASDKRFSIYHCSFANLKMQLTSIGISQIDGILFDLGVSSPQLDDPNRGFSFSKVGELDMRMDTSKGMDAKTWIAQVDEEELANVLWKFGEEKFSRRIAKAIVTAREQKPITTTEQLANIIVAVLPKQRFGEKHPATRSFQAIRIVINQELIELTQGLEQAFALLKVGGRLAVISFHSLEDRIVKQFIKQYEKGEELPRGLPIKGTHFKQKLRMIAKPIKPSLQEVNMNPRSRSAILRIAEKLS